MVLVVVVTLRIRAFSLAFWLVGLSPTLKVLGPNLKNWQVTALHQSPTEVGMEWNVVKSMLQLSGRVFEWNQHEAECCQL